MTKIKSFERWVEPTYTTGVCTTGMCGAYTKKAHRVILDDECQDLDWCPMVGEKVTHGRDGEEYTVASPPKSFRNGVAVFLENASGRPCWDHLEHLHPSKLKRFRAIYPGESEADVRVRFGVSDRVVLEEVDER